MKEKSKYFDVDYATEFADCDSTPADFVDEQFDPDDAIKDHEACKDSFDNGDDTIVGSVVLVKRNEEVPF